jgi:hypothetical protein
MVSDLHILRWDPLAVVEPRRVYCGLSADSDLDPWSPDKAGPPERHQRRAVPRPIPLSRRPKGPTVNTLIPEDPAAARFEALVDALGNPALSGYESTALARIVSWATDEDVQALVRLVRQAREEGDE